MMHNSLQRMLDLPPELKCGILGLLIVDKDLDAYYTLLEHAEIAELLQCKFNQQFQLIKGHRPLVSQLQQILTTTALLSTNKDKPRSSRQLAKFLRNSLHDEGHPVPIDSAKQAVAVLNTYRNCLRDAEFIAQQFTKMNVGNEVIRRHPRVQSPLYGTDTLSEVEYHRILRAFLRLQLYTHIRKLYGAERNFKRKPGGLFSLWTPWKFDEVRSVAEWIVIEYSNLPKAYAEGME